MKILVMSFDDGTVYDRRVIELLRQYKMKATFNLNSGLDGYIWYLGDRPIERLVLKDNVSLYKGMEVASHSVNHPHLSELTLDEIGYQIGKDKENLEAIFGRPVTAFAVPFSDYDERTIQVLERLGFTSFRTDANNQDFAYPKSNLQIGINADTEYDDQGDSIARFIKDKSKDSLYIFAGHSYDFEVHGNWDHFEAFLKRIKAHPEIKVMTMSAMVKHHYRIG